MHLYKQYKQEKDLQEKEAADKEYIGDENVVIIYEQSKGTEILKSIIGILGLIILLIVLVIGVVFVTTYFNEVL